MNSAPLISSQELTLLHQRVLSLKTRQAVASTFAPGQHLSHYRGEGVELDDTRPYHHGDDIRHMDWRATARSGKATMKVFREEKQRSLYLIVDKSATMSFGTRTTLKANIAAQAAAILIFSALTQHETTAGVVVENHAKHFEPTRELNHSFEFINAIASPLSSSKLSLWHHIETDTLFNRIKNHTQRGYTLVIISDFIGFNSKHMALLGQLAQHRQIIGIQVSDPAEESLPNIGKTQLYSPITQQQLTIDTSNPETRQAYEEHFRRHRKSVNSFFASCDAPLHSINTTHDVFSRLEAIW